VKGSEADFEQSEGHVACTFRPSGSWFKTTAIFVFEDSQGLSKVQVSVELFIEKETIAEVPAVRTSVISFPTPGFILPQGDGASP